MPRIRNIMQHNKRVAERLKMYLDIVAHIRDCKEDGCHVKEMFGKKEGFK